MKLWLLEPKSEFSDYDGYTHNHNLPVDPWNPWFDKTFGFVIRAETEEDARKYAAEGCGDEGEQAWLDEQFSNCVELVPDGEPGIVLTDHHSA